MNQPRKIAIIGGSGLYTIDGIEEQREHTVDTPFGPPSDLISSGILHGTEVYFLPRHGKGHRLTPSEINYRANIFALKSLGVEWCISVSAVGSLIEEYAPGDVVIPDQVIDRTRGRTSTFFGDGVAAHIGFADPFCPTLSTCLYESASKAGAQHDFTTHRGGTYICMEGPAFSTRAESELYRSWGARLIGMTALPEAKLAREAEIAYGTLALVTDYDCWRQGEDAVEVAHIIETMKRNTEHAKLIVSDVVARLKSIAPSELASAALATAFITAPGAVSTETRSKLAPIIGKYFSS
jgi:5'-methylthioadenosine phosphorylase